MWHSWKSVTQRHVEGSEKIRAQVLVKPPDRACVAVLLQATASAVGQMVTKANTQTR
jgi:hypothetical protein